MPWHIGTSEKCPAGKPYAVIKDATGEVEGCHETEEEATAQMRALYASDTKAGETTMNYLKTEQLKGNKWRVLAIPFGGPFDGKDLDGEFFSKNTDIKPDWFDRRPLVWHHNLDQMLKADPVIGTADDLEPTDEGWWTTVWMDRSHRYFEQIAGLLSAGKVYGSSGSLPNFVKTDKKTGEILVWPYIEQTFTPTPSNIFSRVVAAKAIDHFAEARIGLPPALRDIFTDLDSQTADLPADLPPGGDAAATQRLEGNPETERARRLFVATFTPERIGALTSK